MKKRLLALLAVAVLIAGALLLRSNVRLDFWNSDAGASDALVVEVACAAEIEEFCAESIETFESTEPEVAGRPIRVDLRSGDSAQTAEDIVDRRIRPLVWIPASTAFVDEANAQYRARNGQDAFLKSGEYQILPMVLSPTVFVIPKDRAAVLLPFCGGSLTWTCIRDAIASPGWREIPGGNPNWGLVKFGYANPTTTDTGLFALILQSYGFYGRPNDLTPEDVTSPEYVEFVTDIGKSVTSFADNSNEYVRDLVLFCPSAFDIASTYEFVAATSIDNAQGRGCDLQVVYPEINANSDFPFAILVTTDSTAEEKDAALALRAHMYGKDNQQNALRYGLRPANPDIPVVHTTDNPLAEHTADGIQLTIPRAALADLPPFDTITNMLLTWEQRVAT